MNNQKGLYQKYIVTKANGKDLAPGFQAVVLRIDGGRYLDACRAGAAAFGEAVREHNPELADDISSKLKELRVISTRGSENEQNKH